VSRIDLHIHTSASDGTCSPGEILHLAHALKLRAIAITDHDTLEGVKAALVEGIPPDLGFLTGVEVSAAPPPELPVPATVHILGYDIDVNHFELNRTLFLLQNARRDRNPKILEKLRRLRMAVSLDEIREAAAGGQVGRPHIAQVLVKKNCAASIDDAFDRYLGRGKPAYVDKFRIGCAEAVALIRKAGGLPVLAHPVLLNLDDTRLEKFIGHLKTHGLGGVEIYYPEHTFAQTVWYARLARRYGLLMTGGTDFHGDLKPEIRLGCGKGNLAVPVSLFEEIIKRKWK
jgi:predicted metal-dependent phosphoesterase TrpH